MTSAPTPLELTGTVSLVEAENNTCGTVTFNSNSEARDEVVVAEDTCSTVDSGSTPVEENVNMNFDYAFIQWCRRSV